jgi:transposase
MARILRQNEDMTPNELFDAALQLKASGWRVANSSFSGKPPGLELRLEQGKEGRVLCPECGQECGSYDRVLKRWRHLNFFQYRCEIVAEVPRANCREHGVKLTTVPWAHPGSGFTLLFEALVMLLAGQMPVSEVARVVDEEDTRLWRLIRRLVEEAHAAKDWSEVRAIAIDETSTRRGRCYATVILDIDTRAVLFMAEGRDSKAVAAFCDQLRLHGGDPAQIRWVSMDMLHCYAKGVRENFPNAQVVYDRYHVMVMAGEAVELVRRKLQRAGADLKGSLWALRGNEWNLSPEQQEVRMTLSRRYKSLGRALALRDALQDVYAAPREDGPSLLQEWCAWAARSRLEPFQKLVRTIRQYWTGIVSYFDERITQGAIEAINGIIQLAKRRARGFRNFLYLRTIAYWNTGKLDIDTSALTPT